MLAFFWGQPVGWIDDPLTGAQSKTGVEELARLALQA